MQLAAHAGARQRTCHVLRASYSLHDTGNTRYIWHTLYLYFSISYNLFLVLYHIIFLVYPLIHIEEHPYEYGLFQAPPVFKYKYS